MALHPTTRAILSACIFTATSLAQTAPQNPPAPPPCPAATPAPNQPAKPCTPQTPKKSAAEQFPFPGETSTPPATTPDSPAPASTPPNSPTPTTSPADAAAQHPFPTTPPPKLPGSDDSSSSSSSSGDDPDASPTMPPDDVVPTPTTRHRLPKVGKVQSDDERVDEDIAVAKFYMNDENYQGAYLRAQDAVKTQPDYSLTHFTLAQVLQKMKKKDEAVAEYQLYLKLDPDGDKAKAAKEALAELNPNPKK